MDFPAPETPSPTMGHLSSDSSSSDGGSGDESDLGNCSHCDEFLDDINQPHFEGLLICSKCYGIENFYRLERTHEDYAPGQVRS